MALTVADRVKESSTTTGTGTFTLAGAMTGFKSFTSRLANGATCYYAIIAVDAIGNPSGDWEVGLGTFTTSGTTLARTTVHFSTNSDAAVNFAAGTKHVFIDLSSTQLATYALQSAVDAKANTAHSHNQTELTTANLPVIRPSFRIDFANSKLVDYRIACVRSLDTATYFDANGALQTALANTLRITHDPITLECSGMMDEETRTNIFLNSAVGATQTITVTAVEHTLSFYGTGTVVLSGTGSGTLVGSGAFPVRSTLTFTPTAGSLILTVSGSITLVQLEIGRCESSYIAVVGTAAVRSRDSTTITGPYFSEWFNATEGTFVVKGGGTGATTVGNTRYIGVGDGTSNERYLFGGTLLSSISGGATVGQTSATGSLTAVQIRAWAYKLNDAAFCNAGGTVQTDTTFTSPAGINGMQLGNGYPLGNGTSINGTIAFVEFYPQKLTSAQLIALTS